MTYGFAHRGGSHGPDNAIATFTEALARGAGGLETDGWVSQDGIVILDHDGVAGITGREPISQIRRGELPAHLATLAELYEAVGIDFDLAVDVKSTEVAEAVLTVAQRHGAADRLWLVAPQPSVLADLTEVHRAVTVRGNVMRSSQRSEALETARDARIEAINARWMWWKRPMVSQVHDLGMLAFGYDAQRRPALERSMSIGLDGVFSDQVDRMVAAIKAAAR